MDHPIIALVGMCAALIEVVKLALAAIPNVEGVTLLHALFGYCFGWYGVAASFVFVSIEPLIWGYNTWVLSYYLYWPLVALVFMILGKMKQRNRFVLTATAVLLTVWFGVLTSLVDIGLFTGFWNKFWYRFRFHAPACFCFGGAWRHASLQSGGWKEKSKWPSSTGTPTGACWFPSWNSKTAEGGWYPGVWPTAA